MEDTATDYKMLYEQAFLEHKKALADKDVEIQSLHLELDKYAATCSVERAKTSQSGSGRSPN